jgi:ribonuclease HII
MIRKAPTRFPRPGGGSRIQIEPGDYIGVDEAGRGCLAGSLIIGAVAIKTGAVANVKDSKKIKREFIPRLALEITAKATAYKIVVMTPKYIDEHGIDGAWDKGVSEAIEAIQKECDWHVVIDGNCLPSRGKNLSAFPKADDLVYQVSAASIIAKAKQLELMVAADIQYPGYGFASHNGYGTRAHEEALKKLGPCPIHRKSFRMVTNPEHPLTTKEEMKFSENKVEAMLGVVESLSNNRYAGLWERQFISDVGERLRAGKQLSSRDMFFFNAISRRRR